MLRPQSKTTGTWRQGGEGWGASLIRSMTVIACAGGWGNATYSYFALGFNSQDQHAQSGCFVPRNAIGRRGRQAEPRRSHSSPRGRNSTETLIMGLIKWMLQAKHYGDVQRSRLRKRCPGVWRDEQEESGIVSPVLWQTCCIHSTPDGSWNSLRRSHCFSGF